MTLAYICVVLASVFPFIFAGLAKSDPKRFNNAEPRQYLAGLSGWRQRANWVQENSFEIFPPFAAAVIVAHLTQGRQSLIDGLAVVFLVSRVGYGLAYLTDKATLRSLLWVAGLGCILGLFFASYF